MRLRWTGRRDERGATAVEYGLIVGLIALGVLGSLVVMKTSLNAVFGGVSTQLGKTGTASAPGLNLNPSNTRAAYWAGKTVASGPTYSANSNSDFWLTKFTDGSTASIQIYKTAPLVIEQTFEANSLYGIETDYYNGAISSVSAIKYNAIGGTQQYIYYSSTFDANNNPSNLQYGVYSGSSATLHSVGMTSLYQQQVANGVADTALWLANTPKP